MPPDVRADRRSARLHGALAEHRAYFARCDQEEAKAAQEHGSADAGPFLLLVLLAVLAVALYTALLPVVHHTSTGPLFA